MEDECEEELSFFIDDEEFEEAETHSRELKNTVTARKRFRFLEAITNENSNEVVESIKAGIDIDFIDSEGRSALFYAVIFNNNKIVQALIEAGADINVTNHEGKTPLFYCTKKSHYYTGIEMECLERHIIMPGDEITENDFIRGSMVSSLINAGALINITDYEGKTALMSAIQDNDECLVSTLIDAGADINITDIWGKTALMRAIEDNNESLASAFIDAGADINITDIRGKTALMSAIEGNNECLASSLIDAGADINITDIRGKTALMRAIQDNNECLASTLIDAGADINITDIRGKTALMSAIQDNNECLASSLIDAGADVKVVDKSGKNALFYAAMNGNEKMVSQLIKSLDINCTDNQGRTALMHAVQRNQTSAAAKLIEGGAEVNVTDNEGRTALIYVSWHATDMGGIVHRMYDYEVEMDTIQRPHQCSVDCGGLASMLIKGEANLNITDNQGKTALMHAVQNNHPSLAAKLIESGADLNVTDNDGRTALIYVVLDVNESIKRHRISRFHQNILRDKMFIFRKLIDGGADLNIADYLGKAALVYCVQKCKLGEEAMDFDMYRHYDSDYFYKLSVLALIKAGANINVTDNDGKTALIYSLQNKSKELACALIENGANVNMTDKDGKTTLIHWAEEKISRENLMSLFFIRDDDDTKLNAADHKKVVTMLLKAGVDVNITDNDGKTALVHSLQSNNNSLAYVLLEAGADVNLPDNEGITALLYFAQSLTKGTDHHYSELKMSKHHGDENEEDVDCKKITSMIIKASSVGNLNGKDKEGKTALFHSLEGGNPSLTCALVEAGADVNAVDGDGKTPLLYAAIHSFRSLYTNILIRKSTDFQNKTAFLETVNEVRDMFIKVIKAGADVNITDLERKTALIYYAENLPPDELFKKFPIHLSKHLEESVNTVAYELIKASANVNTVDKQGRAALTHFLESNNASCALQMIRAGADVNIVDGDGKNAFFYASKSCDKQILEKLIEASTDIDITDIDGKTALMSAIQDNNECLASTLIDAGADVKVVDKSGKNALFYAAMNGNEKMVSQLIKSLDINCTDNQGRTALMHAVQRNQTSAAAKLIEGGAEVNVTDNEGRTALIYVSWHATDMGGIEHRMYDYEVEMDTIQRPHQCSVDCGGLASMLIKGEANLNITDNQGKTALMHAVQNNHPSLAAKLIESGADLNVTDNDGRTALIYISLAAIAKGSREYMMYFYHLSTLQSSYKVFKDAISMAHMLIKGNANLNITDNQRKTALMYSLEDNKLALTYELINAGAEVNITDGEGRTALFYAMLCNSERVVQALINAGVDVNIIDIEGRSALIHFAQGRVSRRNDKSPGMASKLIKIGAEINITDNKGKTALMYALQNSNERLACTLIDSGADVKTVDKSGKTALFYVLSNRNRSMAYFEFENWLINEGTIPDIDEEVDLTHTFQDSKESIIFKLIEAGADVNVLYNEGKTALIYSVENGYTGLAYELIVADANVNVADNQGKTALIHCSEIQKKKSVHMPPTYRRLSAWPKTNFTVIARRLLDAGADVNMTDNQGKTALIYCAQNCDEAMVSSLIKAGANVNIVDHDGGTALFYGIGNANIVHCLINSGKILINKRDKYNRSPLFYAITTSLATARYLLDRGCTMRRKDHTGLVSFFIEFCLTNMCNYSHMSGGLKLLQEKGVHRETIYEALIDSVFCRILFTTTMESQKSSRTIEQVTRVLTLAEKYITEDDGHKVEIMENSKLTMRETSNLSIKIPKILGSLQELGGNPSYTDSNGNTPLHYVTCLPLTGLSSEIVMKICHQLNDLGASVHDKNYESETPLLFCLSKKDWVKRSKVKLLVEVCRVLLEQGSSAEETTQNRRSVFHLIIELFQQGLLLGNATVRKTVLNECLELLQLFTTSRVPKEETVNRRDGISGNSPLHLWATLEFNSPPEKHSGEVDPKAFEKQIITKIFEPLFACGAKLNGRNGIDQTPLHLCKTWTAAKVLIDAGAKTNVVDSKGSSPLLVAVEGSPFLNEAYSGHVYPDFQQPYEFWKTVIENKLNPWIMNNLGKSVMEILVQSEAFVLAKALLDVACSGNHLQNDGIAVSLLNSICRDHSTRAQWKSILVGIILKGRKNVIVPRPGEDTALHFCCRNIVRETEKICQLSRSSFPLSSVDILKSDVTASVHWTIVKQLLSHGFRNHCHDPDKSGMSCIDIASKCPLLNNLLTKSLTINEVPLVIPWTSISKTHKSALAKVARGQECEQIRSFWYHKNNIQKGSFGLIFVGINENDGREVAIKRIEKLRMHRPEDKREISSLTKLADCEQVVRYLHFFEEQDFSYIVLELMEGNLNDYLDGNFDVKKSVQLCADVVKGLKYLHEQSIVHRDLKPSNILFKTIPMLCLKISDFGLSRCIDKCSTSATMSGSLAGTRCWIAPEVLNSSYKEHSMASDVFSCGLLLHYILKVKRHPFSPANCANISDSKINNETEANIMNDKAEGWESSLCHEATDLIKRMINRDKGERPTAVEALAHPLFWSRKKKTIFLIAVGNQPEISQAKVTPSALLTDLENNFSSIVKEKTWDDSKYSNMPAIYAEMTKERKPYDTSSVAALLRFIRNAWAHVSDARRPTPVRKLLVEDFVFLEYFPSLVSEVFKCVKAHEWDTSREEIKYALDDAKT